MTTIEGNTVSAIRRRAELQQLIIPLSAEIERLYLAKEDYFNKSIIPDPTILTPPQNKPNQMSDQPQSTIPNNMVALMQERNNLRSWLTKNRRNAELFSGPKQAELKQRILEKETRCAELTTLLKQK